jgi:hypothetical protein
MESINSFEFVGMKDLRNVKKRKDLLCDKHQRNFGLYVDHQANKSFYNLKQEIDQKEENDPYYITQSDLQIDNMLAEKVEGKCEFINVKLVDRGRTMHNSLKGNRRKHNRNRSSTPPPKKYRTRCGINKGKPSACSFCRPEIFRRMMDKSIIRRNVIDFNKHVKNHTSDKNSPCDYESFES